MRAFVRFREVPERERHALRQLVRARPLHRRGQRRLLRAPLRHHDLVDPDALPQRALERRDARLRAGRSRADIPDDDALEAYWRAYYSSIFNPARLKIGAMTSEMPRKYWKNLPEAAAIPELIRTAAPETDTMVDTPSSPPQARPRREPHRPHARRARRHRAAAGRTDAQDCRRCDLWEPATQAVFGEGPPDARIMIVGEQPGDQEDLAGRPFVGPAGQLLDRAMAEAGLDRSRSTSPTRSSTSSSSRAASGASTRSPAPPRSPPASSGWSWSAQECSPALTVMLGASAARAVLGRTVTISRERGRPIPLRRQQPRLRHRPPVLPAPPAGRGRQGARIRRLRPGPARRPRPGRLSYVRPTSTSTMPSSDTRNAAVRTPTRLKAYRNG